MSGYKNDAETVNFRYQRGDEAEEHAPDCVQYNARQS